MDLLEKLGITKKSLDKALNERITVLDNLVHSTKVSELVLSDGRIAEIFEMKLGHFVYANDANEYLKMAKLIAVTTLIDGDKLTIKDALNLSAKDFQSITKHLV